MIDNSHLLEPPIKISELLKHYEVALTLPYTDPLATPGLADDYQFVVYRRKGKFDEKRFARIEQAVNQIMNC